MMKLESTKSRVLWAIVPLLLATAVGVSAPPALSQDEGGEDEVDIEACTADKITYSDGKICIHNLKCETLEAEEVCFRIINT